MKFIIANWKMNMNLTSLTEWLEKFNELSKGEVFKSKVIIAPSFVHIPLVKEKLHNVAVSAQDIDLEPKGAHTGSVGAEELVDFCTFCIVGHSERHEAQETVLKKRDACLEFGITPITCFVNPTDITKVQKGGTIVAWEDPANISVNGVYKPKDTVDIVKQFNYFNSLGLSAIYGGSVSRQNAYELANISGLEGVLVGNASLDAQHFFDIVKAFER